MNEGMLQNIEKYLKNLAALSAIIIFLFVITIFVMFAAITSCDSDGNNNTYKQECVVPRTDLEMGHTLAIDDLAMRGVVFSNYNSSVYNDDSASLLVGHTLAESISAGTPITKEYLSLKGEWPPQYEDSEE